MRGQRNKQTEGRERAGEPLDKEIEIIDCGIGPVMDYEICANAKRSVCSKQGCFTSLATDPAHPG